jgi:hypothetical protein
MGMVNRRIQAQVLHLTQLNNSWIRPFIAGFIDEKKIRKNYEKCPFPTSENHSKGMVYGWIADQYALTRPVTCLI